MANEIAVNTSLTVTNGELVVSTPSTAKQFDQTTARGGSFTVDAATSETTVDFGDVVPGWVQLQNLDTTNYTEWTTVSGNYDLKISPNGGKALFELSGAQTLYLKANTAGTKVQVTVVNS